MTCEQRELAVSAATGGPAHHFFGYYDKSPWDATGRYLLTHEVDFIDRQPTGMDPAGICVIDTHEGNRLTRLDDTFGWHWQLGSMLQWLPGEADRKIIYNQREGERLISVIRDVRTGETRKLPMPVYHITRDGRWAITLNFARLHRTRAGYGHPGVPDPTKGVMCPDDDGIWRMDLRSGACELIITLAQANAHQTDPKQAGLEQWFNHLQFNHDGSRFVFLHRTTEADGRGLYTRMMTANADGSGLCLLGEPPYNSHFDWLDRDRIVVWALRGERGRHYWLHTDRTPDKTIIGEEDFTTDGHCSFSPNGKWMLTDTYPDPHDHKRTLMLYDLANRRRIDIGRFYAPPQLQGPMRCDLHPRWSRDGRAVCFDSAHEGERQMYVVDVSEVVG